MKRIFFFLLLIIPAAKIVACQCPPLQPISKELSNKYNVIFYGKVDSVSACAADGISTVYFTINELYKGAVSQHVKIDSDCASPCLMSFEKGEEWIIYASYPKFDKLTVSLCEHSRKFISNIANDYYFITSQRTFEQEKQFLKAELGVQSFIERNDLNEQQKVLKPHNDQPSRVNKLFLLLVSMVVMGIVFLVARSKK